MRQPTAGSDNHCAGTRQDGASCAAKPQTKSGWCFTHDPGRAEQRDEARRRGGHNRSNSARLRGLVPPRLLAVYNVLETAMTEVHDGTLDPRAATAMASLGRALVAVLQAGELEERVRDLEGRLSA